MTSWTTNKIKIQLTNLISIQSLRSSTDDQGYVLEETAGPWLLTFVVGHLGNPRFLIKKSYTRHPGFLRFKTFESPQFFLEHSLDHI